MALLAVEAGAVSEAGEANPDAHGSDVFDLLGIEPLTTNPPANTPASQKIGAHVPRALPPVESSTDQSRALSDALDWRPTLIPEWRHVPDAAASSEPAEPLRLVSETVEAEPIPAAPAPVDDDPLNRPIVQLTVDGDTSPRLLSQMDKLPDDFAIKDKSSERFGSWEEPTDEAASRAPRFQGTLFTWAAPALYHRPLLFEQPNVERYGHYVGCCPRDNLSQSAISAAHFFATVPVLPYKIGASGGLCGWGPESACDYTLGSYRPGSCNPHQLLKPRWSWRGLLYQGAATTGLVFVFP